MIPVEFKEGNKTLYKPQSMTDEECSPLVVYTDTKQCISCWKPSFRERVKVAFGGKVWLGVLSGTTQPPVFVVADYPFIKPNKGVMGRFGAWCVDLIKRIFKRQKGAEND